MAPNRPDNQIFRVAYGQNQLEAETSMQQTLRPAHLGLDHLHDALRDQLPYPLAPAAPHDHHERLHDVVLEREVRQLGALQVLDAQLAQAVNCVHCNLLIVMLASGDKVVAQHRPNARPHQPDAGDVVVTDLDQLLEAEDAGGGDAQLALRHLHAGFGDGLVKRL
jgi:hypothetical protein